MLLTQLEMKEASLVGHSQGCLVVLECASQFPEKIKSITLMGGAGAIPMNPELLRISRKRRSKSCRSYDGLGSWTSRTFWWSSSSRFHHINLGGSIVQNKGSVKNTLV